MQLSERFFQDLARFNLEIPSVFVSQIHNKADEHVRLLSASHVSNVCCLLHSLCVRLVRLGFELNTGGF